MSTPTDIYRKVHDYLTAGEAVAVATVVRTRGSSPREVGAKMVVRGDGRIDGTVGGGCGEGLVWRTALEVMGDYRSRLVTVDLTEPIAMNTDGVCGGIMEVFVEPWVPEVRDDTGPLASRQLALRALDVIEGRQPAVCATVVDRSRGLPCEPGAKVLILGDGTCAGSLGWEALQQRVLADVAAVLESGRSQVRTYDFESSGQTDSTGPSINGARPGRARQVDVFFELFLPPPTLVIVGAGHIALALAQVGKLLEFEVVVIDDRPSFANRERFPMADRIIVGDFEPTLANFPITSQTYLVLVTRGHVHDVVSLRRVIDSPAAYIGMIGSRRRVFAVFKLLHAEGVPIDKIMRVHAPIGLDIKTETPGEIAVSIGAEILKVRRGGGAQSFSDLVRDRYARALAKGAPEPEPA